MCGISHRVSQKRTLQALEKRLKAATRAVVIVFKNSEKLPVTIFLEVVGDSVTVQIKALGNKAVFCPLVVHPDDQ